MKRWCRGVALSLALAVSAACSGGVQESASEQDGKPIESVKSASPEAVIAEGADKDLCAALAEPLAEESLRFEASEHLPSHTLQVENISNTAEAIYPTTEYPGSLCRARLERIGDAPDDIIELQHGKMDASQGHGSSCSSPAEDYYASPDIPTSEKLKLTGAGVHCAFLSSAGLEPTSNNAMVFDGQWLTLAWHSTGAVDPDSQLREALLWRAAARIR